jgi:hypothetical protein
MTMSCGNFDAFEPYECQSINNSLTNIYLEQRVVEHPEIIKILKMLKKTAHIQSVSFAGSGSFDKHGVYHNVALTGNFEGLIAFTYPFIFDIKEQSAHDEMPRPKVHYWPFGEIK